MKTERGVLDDDPELGLETFVGAHYQASKQERSFVRLLTRLLRSRFSLLSFAFTLVCGRMYTTDNTDHVQDGNGTFLSKSVSYQADFRGESL
jgi:hypothetical protein